jgi:antitoxin VapB
MALNIKDPETDRLARGLAQITGESITVAVKKAIREQIEGIQGAPTHEEKRAAIGRIQARVAARGIDYRQTEDEILGYDENGIPEQPWLSTPRR